MRLIDRYICVRFFVNFAILLSLLFVFAVAVDLLLNLERFVDAGRHAAEHAGIIRTTIATLGLIVDFQGPRIFIFYGYMHGLVGIGAMAFTLAQMHRHKELVALLASGVSLYRVAMPIVVCMFAVSLLQLGNQEFIMPHVAPLLLRDHGQVGERSLESFPVPFTPDGRGNILQAAQYNPDLSQPSLVFPTVLERDEQGRTVRRLTADSAVWSDEQNAWMLVNGEAVATGPAASEDVGSQTLREPVDRYATDLTPQALTIRRHGQFAAMLSLKQIQEMLRAPEVVDVSALVRFKYARFAVVLINLLVLGLTLPTFLLRAPASLLRQAVICAAIAIPAMMGAGLGLNMDLPGIPPAVGVFLPVILLFLLMLARWTYFKT